MPLKDLIKARENAKVRSRRYYERQRVLHPKPPPGKHGNHARGSRNGRWNRGRIVTSHGYVLVRVERGHPRAFGPPGCRHGYAYEHDIIMEGIIGRNLSEGEVVHHRNGIKTDNRAENLELTTASAHMAFHDIQRPRDELGRFVSSPSEWLEDLRVREEMV